MIHRARSLLDRALAFPETAGDRSGRAINVETLRGLVCLLVVAFHITGSGGTRGVAVDPDGAFAFFNQLLSPVRMLPDWWPESRYLSSSRCW